MALAVLSIDLVAQLAKFEADLGKASRSLDKLAANAKSSFAGLGTVFTGNLLASAAEEAIRGLVNLFPSLIDGVAAFQDLSEETGASAVALASFQTAADVSGVTVKDLAGLMVRLTGNLSKLTDEGKGAGAALKALSIPVAEFRALSPDQQIKRLAEEFDKFADGSGKTATALALFGKSGAQVLKFFKEYQGSAGDSIRLTAEMIAQADAFSDAHAKSRSELRQTAGVIAVQMLPALTALETGFKQGVLEVIGFKKETGGLDPRAILDFAEAGALGLAKLFDVLVAFGDEFKLTSNTTKQEAIALAHLFDRIKLAAPGGALFGEGSRSDQLAALEEKRNSALDAVLAERAAIVKHRGDEFESAVKKTFSESRRLLDPENARELSRMRERAADLIRKPTLAVTLPTGAEGDRDKAFQHFLAQVAKQDELAQAQLDTGGKLAEHDRLRIDLLSQLTDASKKFTLEQQVEGEAAAAALIAKVKRFNVEQDLVKVRQAAQAIEDRAVAAQGKEIDALISGNEALRDQIEEIGRTADQVEELRTARLEHKAAMQEENLQILLNAEASAAEIGAAERVLELLRQQIDLRKKSTSTANAIAKDPTKGASDALTAYMKKIEETGTATREVVGQTLGLLEDDLVNSLATGKFSVSRTIDFIINEFLRLAVVRPLLNSLFSNIGGGGGNFLAKLFGFADGGAFGPGGPVAFANGGIFDSPQLFRFANGGAMSTGVMGEAGPEAVMPLQRGAGGRLGVRAYGGGGGGVTVNQYINNLGGGVSRAELAIGLKQAQLSAVAAIRDAQRRGRT